MQLATRESDAALVDRWLRNRPRMRYASLAKANGCYSLGWDTWFELCLAWARRDAGK